MSAPALTAVICFLNERDEVGRTVESLRATAGDAVDVLLVNDASEPDYDYRAVAETHRCRYVENPRRVGPAAARSLGVDRASTPLVLLLDAHMRFETSDWWQRIEHALEGRPRTLFSVRCPPLGEDGARKGDPDGLGASLRFAPKETGEEVARAWSVLAPEWNLVRRASGPVEAVPCVLGGAYAFRRDFFQEIGGHLGQVMYGGEEPYISMKAWMAGGSCAVLPDVSIGHIYRDVARIPFHNAARFGIYNKMMLLATVFPESRFEEYRDVLRILPGHADAVAVFREHQALLRRLRRHLHEHVFRRPFAFFEQLNAEFREGRDVTGYAPVG